MRTWRNGKRRNDPLVSGGGTGYAAAKPGSGFEVFGAVWIAVMHGYLLAIKCFGAGKIKQIFKLPFNIRKR